MSANASNNQELQFDPLTVPIHPNGSVLTSEESVERWLYLKQISEDSYSLLVSPLLARAVSDMQHALQLSDDAAMRVASALRVLYFGKVSLEQFPQLLMNEVGLPQERSAAVMNFIRSNILLLKVDKSVDSEKDVEKAIIKTEQAVILDALAKYPRLNEQVITAARIKVRGEKEAVRGSVRNWLRAYRDAVGVRQHSAMERGQFIFQSENAKNLSQEEREKVSLILKSLDENAPLAIDPSRQEIVFPPMTVASPAPSQQAQVLPSGQSPVSVPPAQNRPQPSIQSQPQPKQQASFQVSAGMKPTPQPSRLIPEASQWGGKTAFNFSKSAPEHPQTMRFSSGHTLPSERQEVLRQENMPAQPAQASVPRESLSKPSFGLGYIGPNAPVRKVAPVVPQNAPHQKQPSKEVWQVPDAIKNVVDLRSDE